MAKQMEMFEEGGLMDEGGTVDPVSGNDVPPGSTQEEVRDDIPAQLSEGEFVFPADVVRYFGLEKLMEMRQEAKMGLQRMDDMGQMGNSEEAIMPDNLPFDIDDIDMEDDNEPQEFNLGGIVQQPGTGISGYTAPSMPTTGYTPPPVGVAVAPVVPGSQPQVAFTPATAATNIPTFGQFVGTSGGRYDEMVTYVNDAGVVRQIPHVNGKPIYPVPEGFKRQEKPTDVTTDTSLVDTTTTTQQPQGDGGSDRDDSVSTGTGTAKVGSISDAMGSLFGSKDDKPKTVGIGNIYDTAAKTNDYFGGSKAFGWSNEELRGATFKQAGAQFGSLGLTGMVSSFMKEAGVTNFNLKDVGVNGFTAMNDSLNAMGLTNRGQLMNDAQASLVGNAMAAAHAATVKGEDVTAAYNKVMNTPEARATIDKTLTDIRDSYARVSNNAKGISFAEAAEVARADAATFKNEVNDLANPVDGSARITTTNGVPINTIVDPTTGQRIQDPTKSRAFTEVGRQRVQAAEAKQKQAETNAKALGSKAFRDGVTQKDYGKETASEATAREAANKAQADRQQAAREARDNSGQDSDIGIGDSDGGGYGSDAGTGGGGDMGVICLTEDMKVKRNGVIDFVTKVQVGDIVDNTIVTEVLHKHMREGYYKVNGELKITNDHPVLANGLWKRTEDLVLGDYINNVEVTSLEYVEQVTPTVYIGTTDDRYDVYTEGEVYTVHGQYKNALKKAA